MIYQPKPKQASARRQMDYLLNAWHWTEIPADKVTSLAYFLPPDGIIMIGRQITPTEAEAIRVKWEEVYGMNINSDRKVKLRLIGGF